jgi:hypothetical protein
LSSSPSEPSVWRLGLGVGVVVSAVILIGLYGVWLDAMRRDQAAQAERNQLLAANLSDRVQQIEKLLEDKVVVSKTDWNKVQEAMRGLEGAANAASRKEANDKAAQIGTQQWSRFVKAVEDAAAAIKAVEASAVFKVRESSTRGETP